MAPLPGAFDNVDFATGNGFVQHAPETVKQVKRELIKITKPYQRVRYELQEIGQPTLQDILMKKFGKK